MIPGKKYTVDDAVRILRRRYWLLIVPCAIVGALMASRVRTLPDMYYAQTVIMVIPQTVPTAYVQPVVASRIEQRLQTLRTTILSRTRLERIIERFDLYPELRRQRPMEEVVERMRWDIGTETMSGDSFRVSYIGYEPVVVMQVTDSLASLFIDESLRDRQTQAENTNQFLESELAEAKAKLQEQERRLSAWKAQNTGELPSQMDANLQQIQTIQMSLRDIRDSMNVDRARRTEYERQLADLENPSLTAESATNPAAEQAIATATASTSLQLAAAESEVTALQQRGLKPGHPDFDIATRKVRDLTLRLQREITGASSSVAGPALSVAELNRRRRIEVLKGEIAEIDRQLARSLEEDRRLQAVSIEVQRRVEAAPRRETEYIELTRDYATIQKSYEQLLSNHTQSQIATNLERRQVGEQFKLLDPAQLPESPIGPNRGREVLFGLMIGLAIGAGIIGLLEYRDKSFKTDEDIAAVLDLPVLAVVPIMRTDDDVRRGWWRTALVSTGLGAVVAGCLAFAAYVAVS